MNLFLAIVVMKTLKYDLAADSIRYNMVHVNDDIGLISFRLHHCCPEKRRLLKIKWPDEVFHGFLYTAALHPFQLKVCLAAYPGDQFSLLHLKLCPQQFILFYHPGRCLLQAPKVQPGAGLEGCRHIVAYLCGILTVHDEKSGLYRSRRIPASLPCLRNPAAF